MTKGECFTYQTFDLKLVNGIANRNSTEIHGRSKLGHFSSPPHCHCPTDSTSQYLRRDPGVGRGNERSEWCLTCGCGSGWEGQVAKMPRSNLIVGLLGMVRSKEGRIAPKENTGQQFVDN